MVKQIISIIILFFINIYTAFSNNYNWSFSGIFGHYDNAQIQRGLQIYKQVCSNCHSLNYVSFNALSDLNYSQEQINYLQNYYKANYFPKPFKNDSLAREANNGSIPPDLSNITKQRSKITINGTSGADYIANLLLGYQESTIQHTGYYNPYFYNGNYINMPPPLFNNIVEYKDGTVQTTEQYAKDVSAFLYWCANPHLVEQHEMGFGVVSFFIILIILIYNLKKQYNKNLLNKDNNFE